MSKTLAQYVREHALSEEGDLPLFAISRDDVIHALLEHLVGYRELYLNLTMTERRMFALFVACKLESEGVSGE